MEKQKQIPSSKECTIYGVTEQFKSFISVVGFGFHPDTDFADYINLKTGKPLFSKRGAELNNKEMEDCFTMCEKEGIDIYEIALNAVIKSTLP